MTGFANTLRILLAIAALAAAIFAAIFIGYSAVRTGPEDTPALIAVASNFEAAADALAEVFEQETGMRVSIISGSTGRLYTQILHGAPFDAFLAADDVRPALLERDGHAVDGSHFTYAVGRLVIVSASDNELSPIEILRSGDYDRLAIANPQLAPYGAAATDVIAHLEIGNAANGRLVYGETISQSYTHMLTGNASLGLVALSLIIEQPPGDGFLTEPIPLDWHRPIRQDAVLLDHGRDDPAAIAWMTFLRSETARAIIREQGYEFAE